MHALDCLLSGGCTSALLVLGGVHVDADGGCGLVRGAGQNLHSKFQEEISEFKKAVTSVCTVFTLSTIDHHLKQVF